MSHETFIDSNKGKMTDRRWSLRVKCVEFNIRGRYLSPYHVSIFHETGKPGVSMGHEYLRSGASLRAVQVMQNEIGARCSFGEIEITDNASASPVQR